MKQKLLFLFASLIVCVGAMAQWTHPEPSKMDIVYGDTVYLYNVEAQAFFRGANSWGTRASVDAAHGYKCVLLEEEGKIAIKDSVEDKGKMFYVRAKNFDDIYVDCNDADMGYRFWSFTPQADGSYTIQSLTEGFAGHLFGVDLTSDNNTVLWLIDPAEYAPEQIQTKWWIVSMKAYDEYMAKYSTYAAATALAAKIEEAKGFGLDVAAAEGVYANTASTKEELDAATEDLQKAINNYKEGAATPDNPQDLTSTFIPDGDFELNQGAGVWQRTHSAQNYQTSGTPGKMGDSTTFLEAWHGSAFTGKMYVPITGLPNGVYQFFLSVATNGGNGCYVYAGTDSVEVTTGDNMTAYTVFTRVEDGTLEVGLNMPNAVQNWVGIDDAKLLYLGNSVASYAYWVNTNMQNAPQYDEDSFVQASLVAEYTEMLGTDLNAFTTVADVLAFNDKFNETVTTIKANAEAYAKYAELCEEAEGLQAAGYAGAEADDLYDYISETVEDIMNAKELSTEEMLAEYDKLHEMVETVKAKCLAAGMDCTNLMVNPNFTSRLDGWTSDSNYASVAWGGLSSNPCVERWNDNFDFYQQLTGVPNGVYELKVQAFYRPTGDTKESYNNYIEDPKKDEILAYIYANTTETPVLNIGAHTFATNLEDNCTVVGDNLYVPNGMNSASNAFSQGAYENTVVGVVTDGTLKVGIKSTTGSASGRWTLWDNFRLTFIGMDKDAIANVVESLLPVLDELEANKMNKDVHAALQAAYFAAYDATTGEEKFAALTKLLAVIAETKENIAAYNKLSAALEEFATLIEGSTASEATTLAAMDLFNETWEGRDNGVYTTAEALAKIEKINELSAALRVPAYADASDATPVDMTQVIINPDFEANAASQQATGWTLVKGEGASGNYQVQNGYDGGVSMEFWSNTNGSGTKYDFYQHITSLPAGTYELTAEASNSLNGQQAGPGEGRAYIYAGAAKGEDIRTLLSEPIAIQTEGCTEARGNYSVIITLKEGEDLVIGSKNIGELSARWVMIDNFKLSYFGTSSTKQESPEDASSIDYVQTAPAAPAAIYNLNGQRLLQLQKGINIVGGKKILVK